MVNSPGWMAVVILLLVVCILQHVLIFKFKHDGVTNLKSEALGSKDKSRTFSFENGRVMSRVVAKYHELFHNVESHEGFKQKEAVLRVAVIVPYMGNALPAWFDTFAMTAHASSTLFDWLIFVTDAPRRDLPPNVKMIKLTRDNLYKRLSKLDNSSYPSGDSSIAIRELLEKNPYILVEFKPCLGFLFEDHLSSYSHWAYADIDQLLGRMHNLVNRDVLTKYDIYTASFGDNFRMYMRGQLTIHRNDPFINNLWRSCEHLSQLNDRLWSSQSTGENAAKGWRFESAEGCYSRVVATHANVSVLVGNTQISDAFNAPLDQKESFLLGSVLVRCYDGPAEMGDQKLLESLLYER